ncbi:MAG TPA: hypothetical protein VFB25_14405 [Gaiellaceae bacterium]|nr:hypothetical protein [Gaiellaceae bacterium]
MAIKFALFLKRHPVLVAVVLTAFALVAASFGHMKGTWDGPI